MAASAIRGSGSSPQVPYSVQEPDEVNVSSALPSGREVQVIPRGSAEVVDIRQITETAVQGTGHLFQISHNAAKEEQKTITEEFGRVSAFEDKLWEKGLDNFNIMSKQAFSGHPEACDTMVKVMNACDLMHSQALGQVVKDTQARQQGSTENMTIGLQQFKSEIGTVTETQQQVLKLQNQEATEKLTQKKAQSAAAIEHAHEQLKVDQNKSELVIKTSKEELEVEQKKELDKLTIQYKKMQLEQQAQDFLQRTLKEAFAEWKEDKTRKQATLKSNQELDVIEPHIDERNQCVIPGVVNVKDKPAKSLWELFTGR